MKTYYCIFRDFFGVYYETPINMTDPVKQKFPGTVAAFHSKGLARRFCKIKNAKRDANVKRIEQLRKFITLGRPACRLLRKHYNRYINDYDRFCSDYGYKTKTEQFNNALLNPATL